MRDNCNFLSIKFEISVIFGNISEIYQKHVQFAQALKQRDDDIETALGEILHKNVSASTALLLLQYCC